MSAFHNPAGTNQAVTEEEFNQLACELFALQFTHNAPYQTLCRAKGVQSVSHWTQIPAVPTAAFKELELTSLPAGERTAVFHSSGTTEQRPSRHFHSVESLHLYEASLLPWYQAHFDEFADVLHLFLTPPPALSPRSSLVHMFECIRTRYGGADSSFTGMLDAQGAWAVDVEKTLATITTAAAQGRPIALLGTAFSFVHLVDFLAERQIDAILPPGSCVLETGGYKGRSRTMPKAELHALITKYLGVADWEIVCEYGMSELSSQAYDRAVRRAGQGRRFHFPPWARVQIISPETGRVVEEGETGLIRVCDLANVRSVMAIQTEDLGVRRGNGFELLGRVVEAEPRGCSLMAV